MTMTTGPRRTDDEPEQDSGPPRLRTTVRRGMQAALGVALAAVLGLALASWLADAAGSGEASAQTLTATISPGTGGTNLYPGGNTTFVVAVNNPNPYAISLVSVDAGSSGAVNTCSAGAVTSAAYTAGANTIPAGGSQNFTLTATMDLTAGAANVCQGQLFTLNLTGHVKSADF